MAIQGLGPVPRAWQRPGGATLGVGEESMGEIEVLIHAADDAINREDFDAVMGFYADDATLVVKPGLNATGREQIRNAFVRIAEYFNHSLQVVQDKLVVVEGGDTALVLGKAEIRARDASGGDLFLEREATYVFRKFPDGSWRCVVDNSYGTSLLREGQVAPVTQQLNVGSAATDPKPALKTN